MGERQAAAGVVLSTLWLLASPLRRLRQARYIAVP